MPTEITDFIGGLPITVKQIELLEKQAIRQNKAVRFINEQYEICLIVPWGTEGLRDIAYDNIYEIILDNGIITKNVYKKRGLTYFSLTEVSCKANIDDDWQILEIADKITLPSEYQQVNYLKGNAFNWIDTGVVPDINTSVDITFKSLNINVSQYIFGSRARPTSTIGYAINGSSTRDSWEVYFNGKAISSNMVRTEDVIRTQIQLYNGTGQYICQNLNTGESTSVALNKITVPTEAAVQANLFLFSYNADTANSHQGVRIYRCKIWQGDELVRDFIPCYRKSDNEAGMYDTVTNKFYTNDGTKTFTVGTDVGKNLLGLSNRAVINFGGSTNSTKRTFPGGKGIIVGLAANNYYCSRGELVSYGDLGFSFIPAEDWYGIGFDVKLLPNTTYKFSMDYNLGSPSTAIIQYDSQGNFLEYTMLSSSTTITTRSDTDWGVICFRNSKDTLIHIINPSLEAMENTTFDESQLEEPNQSLLDVNLLDEFILE